MTSRTPVALDIVDVLAVGNALRTYRFDVSELEAGYGMFAAVMLKRAHVDFAPRNTHVVEVSTVGDEVEVMINAERYVQTDPMLRQYLLISELYAMLWMRRYGEHLYAAHLGSLVECAGKHADVLGLYEVREHVPVSQVFDLGVVDRFVHRCAEEAERETDTWVPRAAETLSDLMEILILPEPEASGEETDVAGPDVALARWVASQSFQSEALAILEEIEKHEADAIRTLLVFLAPLLSSNTREHLSTVSERRYLWQSVFAEAMYRRL